MYIYEYIYIYIYIYMCMNIYMNTCTTPETPRTITTLSYIEGFKGGP